MARDISYSSRRLHHCPTTPWSPEIELGVFSLTVSIALEPDWLPFYNGDQCWTAGSAVVVTSCNATGFCGRWQLLLLIRALRITRPLPGHMMVHTIDNRGRPSCPTEIIDSEPSPRTESPGSCRFFICFRPAKNAKFCGSHMLCSQALPRPCGADSSPIVSVDVVFRPSPMMSSS